MLENIVNANLSVWRTNWAKTGKKKAHTQNSLHIQMHLNCSRLDTEHSIFFPSWFYSSLFFSLTASFVSPWPVFLLLPLSSPSMSWSDGDNGRLIITMKLSWFSAPLGAVGRAAAASDFVPSASPLITRNINSRGLKPAGPFPRRLRAAARCVRDWRSVCVLWERGRKWKKKTCMRVCVCVCVLLFLPLPSLSS